MEFITAMDLSAIQWVVLIASAFFVGFSKTGISGLMMLLIPILASVFGGKESTGLILPMLLAGDVFAVWYYHRHAEWSNIKKLLHSALSADTLNGSHNVFNIVCIQNFLYRFLHRIYQYVGAQAPTQLPFPRL